MARATVRYAVPMSFGSLEPWHRLNSAEARVLDLVYDGPLRAADPGLSVEFTGECVVVKWPGAIEFLVVPLATALARMNPGRYSLERLGDRLVVATESARDTRRALSSSTTVPFCPSRSGVLGSSQRTNGLYQPMEKDGDRLVLRANPEHRPRAGVDEVVLTTIADPARMVACFENDEVDVFPIGGEDHDSDIGDRLRALDGMMRTCPSNAISLLLVRDNGPFADPRVRGALRAALPVAEFFERYIGGQGEPISGLTPARRSRPVPPATRLAPEERLSVTAEFLLGPSPRAIARAEWLAEELAARSGIKLMLNVLTWPDYWAAQEDPRRGDILWCGLMVGADSVEDWIARGLFGGLLGLPSAMSGRLGPAPYANEKLYRVEEQVLAEGWLFPLYKHHQCYLWRSGLEPVPIQPVDWPIPGARGAAALRWNG